MTSNTFTFAVDVEYWMRDAILQQVKGVELKPVEVRGCTEPLAEPLAEESVNDYLKARRRALAARIIAEEARVVADECRRDQLVCEREVLRWLGENGAVVTGGTVVVRAAGQGNGTTSHPTLSVHGDTRLIEMEFND